MPTAAILLKIAAIPERVPVTGLNLRRFADGSGLGQKPHPLSIGKRSRYPPCRRSFRACETAAINRIILPRPSVGV